jgi:serine protease Do
MIGVNVAVRAGAQGIGFAIPVDKAISVACDLLDDAASGRVWHGIKAAKAPPANGEGIVVESVGSDTPAAEAGVRNDDVITAIGDQEIDNRLGFYRAMLERSPGEQLDLSVRRAGDPLTLKLALAEISPALKPASDPAWEMLGIELAPMSKGEFRKRQTRYRGGLTVTDVRPDSPAAEHGVRPGDVLVGMHIWETVSPENVSYILTRPDLASLNPIKVFILRDDETLYTHLPLTFKMARNP